MSSFVNIAVKSILAASTLPFGASCFSVCDSWIPVAAKEVVSTPYLLPSEIIREQANKIASSNASSLIISEAKQRIYDLKTIIGNREIEMGGDCYIDDYLFKYFKGKIMSNYASPSDESEKISFIYQNILAELSSSKEFRDIKKAILLYLANCDYENVLLCEEIFVIDMLHSNDYELNEFALSALMIWQKISDVSLLANISFPNNSIMQELFDIYLTKLNK